jgi:hypothetical protein
MMTSTLFVLTLLVAVFVVGDALIELVLAIFGEFNDEP